METPTQILKKCNLGAPV